jgi:hypothetical protein
MDCLNRRQIFIYNSIYNANNFFCKIHWIILSNILIPKSTTLSKIMLINIIFQLCFRCDEAWIKPRFFSRVLFYISEHVGLIGYLLSAFSFNNQSFF